VVLISCSKKVAGHRHSEQAARHGRPHSDRTEANVKLLLQTYNVFSGTLNPTHFTSLSFRSSRSPPMTLFCQLSGEVTENTFLSVKKAKSVAYCRTSEAELSALHASRAVRVCQLLCKLPLETFKMQVLTNNPGHRRPMNTRLP